MNYVVPGMLRRILQIQHAAGVFQLVYPMNLLLAPIICNIYTHQDLGIRVFISVSIGCMVDLTGILHNQSTDYYTARNDLYISHDCRLVQVYIVGIDDRAFAVGGRN